MTALAFRSDIIGGSIGFNSVSINAVTGFTPKQYDCLVYRWGLYDNGGDTTETANRGTWAITGFTDSGSNTDIVNVDGTLTQRLYFKGVISGSDYVISGWLDSAMTASKVLEGTETGNNGGTVTLAEQNSSGLSGTVVLAATAVADTWYVDRVHYHDRYDGTVDYASYNILGFLYYQDIEESTTLKVWQYIESCKVVDFEALLGLSCVDNVATSFARTTFQNQLRARGLFS